MKNRIFKNCFSVVMALVMALSLNCAAFATYTNGPRNTHYNRDLAADYVADYTTTTNSEYPNYDSIGGDCTNFASQALYAGGMEMTSAVRYPDNASSWYYY